MYFRRVSGKAPDVDRQARFWDWHWAHESERKTRNVWKEQRHEAILSLLQSLPLAGARILDVGCGSGWYTEKLSRCGEVTGIDLSEVAVATATARFPHLTFQQGNFCTMDLPPEHFEVVIAQEVFDHVEDQVAFLERVSFVLKSKGYFVLSCTNRFVMDRLGESEYVPQPPDHVANYLTARELRRTLRSRFDVRRITSVLPMGQRGVLRLVNSNKLNRLLHLVASPGRLEAAKERACLGYQLIALAQKRS